ncbi:hypothetical protein CEXT_544161 [Caerostris extrusa]|uniref:Uncharacterized protein n=1 Tax=Caerostris extrusa TaxID=172846 RepID=A0AAV4VGI2_CAEEX|nr:hypothetical protein CEXT_544161 [Caerostris extrusa]
MLIKDLYTEHMAENRGAEMFLTSWFQRSCLSRNGWRNRMLQETTQGYIQIFAYIASKLISPKPSKLISPLKQTGGNK